MFFKKQQGALIGENKGKQLSFLRPCGGSVVRMAGNAFLKDAHLLHRIMSIKSKAPIKIRVP